MLPGSNLALRDLPHIEQVQRELATRYLNHFIKQAWPIVEPGAKYCHGWHIDAICDHLEAVALSFINDAIERSLLTGETKSGAIRRLIINIPPRHMKSISVSVMFPAWLWSRLPWLRFLFISYAENLSIRDSVKCRRVIQSDWYQQRWGALAEEPKADKDGITRDRRVWLTGDQNQKVKFENNRTGVRQSTSVDGMATGEGGDALVVDDPHNVKDTLAASGVALANVQTWWDEVMPTRLNDPNTGVKIIIMQRSHEKDLTGHILAKEHGFTHLCLPARYEVDHKYKWAADPRSIDGAPLWPEKYNETALKALEQDMSAYAKAGQLQQRPAPREGGMLKRAWFEIVDQAPINVTKRVRWWDLAATKKRADNDPDFTAGARVSITEDGVAYIEHVINVQESPLSVQKIIQATAKLDGKNTHIWMEQEPGSSGVNNIDNYSRKILIGYTFRGQRSTGSKESYVEPFAAAVEAGNVKLVAGSWNEAFIEQAITFLRAGHDDMVDAAAKAWAKCAIVVRARIRDVYESDFEREVEEQAARERADYGAVQEEE